MSIGAMGPAGDVYADSVRLSSATCSGQQNPDSGLDGFSAFAGGTPSLKVCGLTQL